MACFFLVGRSHGASSAECYKRVWQDVGVQQDDFVCVKFFGNSECYLAGLQRIIREIDGYQNAFGCGAALPFFIFFVRIFDDVECFWQVVFVDAHAHADAERFVIFADGVQHGFDAGFFERFGQTLRLFKTAYGYGYQVVFHGGDVKH